MAILDLGKVKLNYKGDWSNASSYVKNDVVRYKSALWIAAVDQAAISGKNIRSPGYKNKENYVGPEIEPTRTLTSSFAKNVAVTTIRVTKETLPGVGQRFFFNRVPLKQFQFVRGRKYRFYLGHSSLTNVDFQLCETADGTTYTSGVTFTGTNGRDGALEWTVPLDAPDSIFYKQVGAASVGGTAESDIVDGWEGYKYWELMSEGFNYRGDWNSATQYLVNDVVLRDDNMFIALCDSTNKDPSGKNISFRYLDVSGPSEYVGYWKNLTNNMYQRDKDSAVHLMNKNPIGWPYRSDKHHANSSYRNYKWIAKDGRVWSSGSGSTGHAGWGHDTVAGFPMEVPLMSQQWLMSEDNTPWTNVDDDQNTRRTRNNKIIWGKGYHTTRHSQPPKAIQICQGWTWGYILLDNGQLLGYGNGDYLGHGITQNQVAPIPMTGLEGRKIIKVDASNGSDTNTWSVYALDDDGNLFCSGYNGYGQLGLGDSQQRNSFFQIPKAYFDDEKIIDFIVQGDSYCSVYARTEKGNIFSWGYNGYGQLGVGDTTNKWRPTKITAWDPGINAGIVKMQVGGNGSYGMFWILDGNGFVWHAGNNDYYQGLDGTTTQHNTLVKSTQSPVAGNCVDFWAGGHSNHSPVFFRVTDGKTYFVGYGAAGYMSGVGDNVSKSTPTEVASIQNVIEIYSVTSYSTSYRTIFLTEKGQLFARGYQNYTWAGNQDGPASNVESNGVDYRPTNMATPAGVRIRQVLLSPGNEGSSEYGGYCTVITEDGRLLYSGFGGYYWGGQWLAGNYWQSASNSVGNFRTVR